LLAKVTKTFKITIGCSLELVVSFVWDLKESIYNYLACNSYLA